jgi:hypothetical protein
VIGKAFRYAFDYKIFFMRVRQLFGGADFHTVLDRQKERLVRTYEQLPDAEALDDEIQKNLKAEFMLDVPVLRPQGEQWAEEGTARIDVTKLPNRIPSYDGRPIYEEVPEFTVHVPFEGDPLVFNVAPSMFNGSIVEGEVVGQEILLTFRQVMPSMNLQRFLDDRLRQINFSLDYLREQKIVFQQGLDAALAQAVMSRKRRFAARAQAVNALQVPIKRAKPMIMPATPPPEPKPDADPEPWDVFISHASQDDPYVDTLKRTFVAAGIRVWVDDGVLRWGNRLRPKIDNGLRRSRFVMFVFSPAFIRARKWPEYELDSAFALETADMQRILPLLHGTSHAQFREYSAGLSDRVYLDSGQHSPTDIANQLLILLARRPEGAFPVAETAPVAEPQSHASEDVRKGVTVAYAWYWTKEGKLAGLYIRTSSSCADVFTLEEPGGKVYEGSRDDIAVRYVVADARLRREGLKRSSAMNSGNYPEFNLP